jgi:hypothetical protein
MRRLAIATLFTLTLALGGCGGDVLVGGASFEGLTTRELRFHVRVHPISGDWARIAVLADVDAPSATWASLEIVAAAPEQLSGGPAQRTTDGRVQLDRAPDYFRPARCADATCELDFVLTLDAIPTSPWSAVVSVTIDGGTHDGAVVDVSVAP